MSDCRFGISPVNYPDPDPERVYSKLRESIKNNIEIAYTTTTTTKPEDQLNKLSFHHPKEDLFSLHLIGPLVSEKMTRAKSD